MNKVRITVMKTASYADLIEQYENPIEHACDMKAGQVFLANGWEKPLGFCDSAWESLRFCDDAGPRRREFLRRLDEKQKVRHDFLQRRIPSRQLFAGSAGYGCGMTSSSL